MKTHECLYENCKEQTTKPKYCSPSCRYKQQYRRDKKREPLIVRECSNPECEDVFKVLLPSDPKKFCSHKCNATVGNWKRRVIRNCQNRLCGKEIPASSAGKKYCSEKCMGLAKTQVIIDSWLSGEFDGSTKHGLSSTIRKYLLKQANYKCQSPTCCVPGGWGEINPVTGNVPLEIDHIDGDAYNNAFANNNLIVLCPNCHSLTASYRALTKESSRKWRKNYSQFGDFEEVVEELIDEENFDKI